jgi:hypothetical protein
MTQAEAPIPIGQYIGEAEGEVVPALVEVEVAVPHLSPAVW